MDAREQPPGVRGVQSFLGDSNAQPMLTTAALHYDTSINVTQCFQINITVFQ